MMHGTPAPGAEPATIAVPAGSSNGSQPSPRLWRATSQPCLQKTSLCQQTETAEESTQPPSRAVIQTTPSPDMKSLIPVASRFQTARLWSSFFVRTVADWNQLEDTVMTADCHCIFIRSKQSATRGCLPHKDSQSKNDFAFRQFLRRPVRKQTVQITAFKVQVLLALHSASSIAKMAKNGLCNV